MTHLTRRRFGQSAAALALATTLPRAAFAQSFRQGGDLRAALTGEPDVLDPATSTIYTGAQVYEGIFSKLIDMDADGNFIPDLATAWTQDDPTTWTFTLAEGVSFHNGEAFTSADVKYSFERILDPATASGYAGLYAQIDSIETPDAKTVIFRLKSPFGPFLTNLATNGQIVNRDCDRKRRSGPQPGRHRALHLCRVDAGRPYHAAKEPQTTSSPACRISTA